MLCERCKKQVATIHLTEIVKNTKTERHLCEDCAREEGIALTTPASLQDVLSGMLQAHEDAGREAALACPACGLTYAEFRQGGRLGCPHDYEVFAEPLRDVFEKVHGATEHAGKVPARLGADERDQRDLLQLRRKLQEAVEEERYEEAARLRDQIREREDAGDA